MYAAIPKDVIALSIRKKGKRIATGLGILDRDYIGIYAIHVAEEYRHRGYADLVVRTLLSEGMKAGASKAYLQVVSDNTPALNLYNKIGLYLLVSCKKRNNTVTGAVSFLNIECIFYYIIFYL